MPYSDIEWSERAVSITGADGKVVFSGNAEVPSSFSDTAATILASKYLYNSARPDGIRSMRKLIDRVSEWIADAGAKQGYFSSVAEESKFLWWLKFVQSHRLAGFNSPVYFNAGFCPDPQLSACFINSLDDNMTSITDLLCREAVIFKSGSGSGVNYSRLRSSREAVQKAGNASGPVSFLRVHDRLASEIKSGGVVRRSARMAILNVDHGDIKAFIQVKAHEERKLNALRAAGIDPFMGNSLPDEVSCQNTNLSVRMTAEFIDAVKKDKMWFLKSREGQVLEDIPARDLMDLIAESAWSCAEPGVHFADNINEWNTVSHVDEIVASNPCSEFMFIDDSACNLAAVNLLGFTQCMHNHPGLSLHYAELMREVVRVMVTAQDIIVDAASYPNELIRANSHRFRPLGLGFTNLAAALMIGGLPYDSDAGRDQAAIWTNFIALCAHEASADLADKMGAYDGYDAATHGRVVRKHALAAERYADHHSCLSPIINWAKVQDRPLRNAQLTLLAPCGTMGYLLDNWSTGIEPFYSHVMHKKLAGGGTLKIVNPCVQMYMKSAGIDPVFFDVEAGRFVGGPGRYQDIFATAQDIPWPGHLKMMAAVQPFLSGSISKCVAGDTLIPTDKGLTRISDFSEIGQAVDSYLPINVRVESMPGHETATKLYYGGVRETICLELVDGRQIVATPNHMVQVEAENGTIEWRRMDELAQGDGVLVKLTNSWNPDATRSSYDIDAMSVDIQDMAHVPDCVWRGTMDDADSLLTLMDDGEYPTTIWCKCATLARDIQALCGNMGSPSIVYRRGNKWAVELVDHMYKPVSGDTVFSVPVYSTECRYTEVFDFVVPSNQTFIGNGLVNHNTVNMPEDATVDDMKDCFLTAHDLGLKSVIPYRDGSKAFQVLTAKEEKAVTSVKSGGCSRNPLPADRTAINHKFSLNGGTFTGYASLGEYPDGRLGEVFLRMSKEGSTIGGLLDALATVTSVALQYNVPLHDLVRKMIHRRFEPAGSTSNPSIPFANSVVDYVFKYIGQRYLSMDEQAELGILPVHSTHVADTAKKVSAGDGVCPNCGAALYRLGACLTCRECAWNGGSCS